MSRRGGRSESSMVLEARAIKDVSLRPSWRIVPIQRSANFHNTKYEIKRIYHECYIEKLYILSIPCLVCVSCKILKILVAPQ